MPTTPDRPDGRPAGSVDSPNELADAEALELASRETVALDRPTERVRGAPKAGAGNTGAPNTGAGNTGAAKAGAQTGAQKTTVLDDAALGRRKTVKVPGPRRPLQLGTRAPLVVAAAFATFWAALWSYVPVAAVIGLARTLEGTGGLSGAAKAALAAWLLGH